MTGKYDAIVVGAGPGGSAAAAHLAGAGARVLLLDRARFPRDKACGGGLTPRGVAALERLGVDTRGDAFLEVDGLELSGAGRASSAPFPETRRWPPRGAVARRRDLDGLVLERAIEAGAEFRPETRVVGPVVEDGVCRGVRVAANGTREEVLADQTIGADGATSALARGMGLGDAPSSGRGFWYAALRGYFGPVEPRRAPSGPVLEFYPLRSPSGRWLPAYGWVFPLPDGTANVGVDIPHRPPLGGCPGLREAYEGFVGELRRTRPGFAGAEPEAPPTGALLPEAMRGFRPGAPGLLLVGDACGLITPYSGEGIVYALESAELAAEAVLEAPSRSAVTGRYADALWAGYGFQMRTALGIMKAMRRPPLARAAASVGIGRWDRGFRAAVRVMAYLIEDDPGAGSTVSSLYRTARRILAPRPRSLWG